MNRKEHLYIPFIFTSLTAFLSIQFFEIFLHPDVVHYFELWLASALSGVVFFLCFLFPVLSVEFFILKISERFLRKAPRRFVRILFFLGLATVLFVQDSLLDHVYYTPTIEYWLIVGGGSVSDLGVVVVSIYSTPTVFALGSRFSRIARLSDEERSYSCDRIKFWWQAKCIGDICRHFEKNPHKFFGLRTQNNTVFK